MRRLLRLVATLAVLLGLAIGLGTHDSRAEASMASPSATPSLPGLRTLTVVIKNQEARVVDLGPPGPSHGDLRVIHALLYDSSGTTIIGRAGLVCVVTHPAQGPSEATHMVECLGTFSLPKGTLTTQSSLLAYSNLTEPPREGVSTITGGTGAYVGARGEHKFTRRSATEVVSTFYYTTR